MPVGLSLGSGYRSPSEAAGSPKSGAGKQRSKEAAAGAGADSLYRRKRELPRWERVPG